MGLFEKYEEAPQTGGLFDKYRQKEEKPSRLSSFMAGIPSLVEAKAGIRGRLGIPKGFDLREQIGGLAERGLEFWRKKTEPEPLRRGAGAFGEGGDIDVILSNIRKQALSVPRFPIDIAQQIFFDEEGQVREPAEVGRAVLRVGGEFAEYGRQNFENYATYISPLSSPAARRKAIESIAEDPLGLFFCTAILKGGIRGGKKVYTAVKEARRKKGLAVEEPPTRIAKELERGAVEKPAPKKIVVGEGVAKTTAKLKAEGVGEQKVTAEVKTKAELLNRWDELRDMNRKLIERREQFEYGTSEYVKLGKEIDAVFKEQDAILKQARAPAGKGISPKRDAELKTFADRSLDQVERGKAAGRTFVWPEAGERGPIQPRITADASTYPQWYRDLTRDYAIKKSQAIKALKEIKKKGMDADGRKYVEAVKESILDAMTEERGRYAQEILKERAKRGVLTPVEKELHAFFEKKGKEFKLTEEVKAKPGAKQAELAGLQRAEAEAITGRKIKKVTGTKALKEEMLGRPEGEVLPGQQKLKAKEGEVELHAGIPIPKPVQEGIDLVTKKLFGKPEGVIEQKVWQIKRDWYYQKEGLTWKFKDKWDRELRDRFSKQERSDMMFYRQRTGNIFKKGDTFEAVESRLSKRARWFVDGEINEHIKNMRKWYNESPWTKDIVAREEVIKTYLTGVYSGNVKKGYDYLVGLKGRSFVTNNFMRNKKTYLTFDEAFRKAGLVPRFRDIADQLQYQDAYLIKNLANNELVGRLNALEKEIGTKLRITSKHHLYDEAKAQGWIPYDDPILRSYRAEKKGAAPVWATTKAPALVHPEVHSALKDVFRKDAFKPDLKFWRGYDTATDLIRTIRVSFSGFHFVPLAESMVGGKGVGALNLPGWIKRGRTLLRDPEFMTEAIGSGLRITAPREATLQTTFSKISGLVNRLEARGGVAKIPAKGINLAAFIPRQITHFLFHKYMPLLKVNIFMDYKHTWLKTMEKKGTKITEPMRKEALTDIAKLTNDQFGAQAWTLMRTWNDPNVMKWIHRAVGYPDWTISALRQAGAGLEGGIRGKLGRRYWLRYGAAFLTAQQTMSYLNTGFYNKKDGSIGWSLDKAHSTFENKDPSHKLNFQLPDVEFTIAGKRINLGREAKYDEEGNFVGWGRLRYSHYGKQMLEIPRYATNTISQVFAKSAPLIQIGLTQVMGGKPYRGEIFPARGKFVEGEFKAWGGTKVGTKARQVERVMQLISDVLPFSVQQIRQAGPGTATLTPISKGLSLWASRDYMEKAIKAEDPDELRQIIEVLVDGGYSGDSIKRTITRVVNRIKKEME